MTVTPMQDSLVPGGTNPRQLDVTVSAPVNTFFMRIFGITSVTATRTSKAEYVQPVPMGSPLNYYGVYQNCKVSGSSISCTAIPDADGSGTLASQGFFGAIEGQGANRGTGDAYATGYDSDPTANGQYDPKGYNYEVSVESAGSNVYIFDPTFCATTSGPGGGHLGAGDHWLSTTNHNTAVPVSTYYRLFDTAGTAFTENDDTLVATSGSMFADEFQVDKSAAYATASPAGGANNNFSDGTEPPLSGGGSAADCKAGAITNSALGGYWHNKWWQIASNVPAGTYRLNVTTTDPTTRRAMPARPSRTCGPSKWSAGAIRRSPGPVGWSRTPTSSPARSCSIWPRSTPEPGPARPSSSTCSTLATWATRRGCRS